MGTKIIHTEITEHFRTLIRGGTLSPNDRLPSIRTVMSEWNVARATVDRAYKTLREEGFIQTNGAAGTIVAPWASDNTAARVASYAATGRALAKNETSQILEVGTVGASEMVASRLDIEPGTQVHMRRRLVSRDGAASHISTSYYTPWVIEAVPELAQTVSTGGSRELASKRLRVPQGHVIEEVTSRHATEIESRLLGLIGNVVVTQVLRVVRLADSRILEVAVKVVHGSTIMRWSTSLL